MLCQNLLQLGIKDGFLNIILLDPQIASQSIAICEEFLAQIKPCRTRIIVILTGKLPNKNYLKLLMDLLQKPPMSLNISIIYGYNKSSLLIKSKIIRRIFLNSTSTIITTTNLTDDSKLSMITNLFSTKINALLPFPDRTKLKIIEKPDGTYDYAGKDYNTLNAIVSHLNGRLAIVNLDLELAAKNVLQNPFHESLRMDNRSQAIVDVLRTYNISMLIHSSQNNYHDDIFENTYPHTQNDLCAVVPKSLETPILKSFEKVFHNQALLVYGVTAFGKCAQNFGKAFWNPSWNKSIYAKEKSVLVHVHRYSG